MSENDAPPSRTPSRITHRNPSFPVISLGEAEQRAKELLDAGFERYPAKVADALKQWGIPEKSSKGHQIIAALKAYTLLVDEGRGQERRLKLSDLAKTILKDQRPGNRERALKRAALSSEIIRIHSRKWCGHDIPDVTRLSELMFDSGFNDEGARRFLGVYDNTMEYANIEETDVPRVEEFESEEDENFSGSAVLRRQGAPDLNSDVGDYSQQSNKPDKEMSEQVVFSTVVRDQRVSVSATGEVTAAVIQALQAFIDFQKSMLGINSQVTKAADSKSADDER